MLTSQIGLRRFGTLALILCLSSGFVLLPARGQTTIGSNNLLANGAFDSGGASWSNTGGGGTYYYGDAGDSICSIGWWDGYSIWQATGATIQPDTSYVLSVRARVGQSPLTGITVSFQDTTAGWLWLTNQTFTFPDQTTAWRVFSFYIDAATLTTAVGNGIGVGVEIHEDPNTQYGWLHMDWVQLAPAKPVITSQPANTTNYAGAPAQLSLAAVGAVTNSSGTGSTLSYQWYKLPATLVTGATSNTLNFATLNPTNAGDYYAIVTGPFGSTQSASAHLEVLPANPPIIDQGPLSQSAWPNQTVSFSVAVSGTPPFTYQWKSNNVSIAGATNSTLTLQSIAASYTGTYSVGVTNQFGGAAASATLTVITPAAGSYEAGVLAVQPQVYLRFSSILDTNLVLNQGSLGPAANAIARNYTTGGYGPQPDVYPNFEAGNLAAQFNGLDTDVQIPPLNFPVASAGTVTMTAWVYSSGPQAGYAGIVFQRGGTGSAASGLDVHATANGNVLAYHWADSFWGFDSGLLIPDYQWCFVAMVVTPTNATLYLRDANAMYQAVNTAAHGTCLFSGNTYVGWDSNGSATDRRFNGMVDEVTIFNRALTPTEVDGMYSASVGAPPTVVTPPAGLTNYTGRPFQLTVVASGAPPMQFQWRKGGSVLQYATNSTYAVASATTGDSGDYDVVVRNAAGAATSAVAKVSILVSAPIFVSGPTATNLWMGLPGSISAVVSGSGPVGYQWLRNGNPLPGQTNDTLVFLSPTAADDALYALRATNSVTQVTSPEVHVAVLDPDRYSQMLYYTNGNFQLRSNYAPIQGVWFWTGQRSRVVTHLGYFDASGSGFLTNHHVGIYQGAPGSGALLASVQVPAGAVTPHLNGYRWVPLTTPFVLQANTNYVLAASDNDLDAWPDAYVPQWNPVYVGTNGPATRYPMWDWPYQDWPHEPASAGQGWGNDKTYGIFNLGSFPMRLDRAGSVYSLTWTLGSLTSSTNVSGPYEPVPGATSPYPLPLNGSGKFYRLQYQ